MGMRSISPCTEFGVAIEQVVGTRRLESDRQGLALQSTIDDARRPQIFGEQVVPRLPFLRNAREAVAPATSPALAKSSGCPSPTSSTRTCCCAASAGAHASEIARNRNCSGPRSTHSVAPSAQDAGIVKFFRVDAVRARRFKRLHAPIDRSLHSRRAGNPAAHLPSVSWLQIIF